MTSMDWDEFSAKLTVTLADLPAGALVVISEAEEVEDGHYTQFAQGDDHLLAYVVANCFLASHLQASQEGEHIISQAGWHESPPGHPADNWWYQLQW